VQEEGPPLREPTVVGQPAMEDAADLSAIGRTGMIPGCLDVHAPIVRAGNRTTCAADLRPLSGPPIYAAQRVHYTDA
jgi:hypothetical protein